MVIVTNYGKIQLLWVFGGLGPEMGSRTYEKGQELLLFLHAGGKAPVAGEISKIMEISEFLGNRGILLECTKNKILLFSSKKHTFTEP